jgi:hypothetical protein
MITPGTIGDWAVFATMLGAMSAIAAGAYRVETRERSKSGPERLQLSLDDYTPEPVGERRTESATTR